jgi:DNA-binding CsgD family transcriptional regulator
MEASMDNQRLLTLGITPQILMITASLLIGSLSVILSFRLMKKYRTAWLSTYFYFIVFLYVFSIYGIIGSNISGILLQTRYLSEESEHAIRLILIFLGMPFMILSWYMFYRFCLELSGRKVSSLFNLVYFLAQSILFLVYAYFLIRILQFGKDLYDFVMPSLIIAYSVITAIITFGGFLSILVNSRSEYDRMVRKNNRLLGYLYIGFFIVQILLLNFSIGVPIASLVFIFLLFSFHVIPIFLLNIYLGKTYVEPELLLSLGDMLVHFAEKYDISKRETEIIEMVWSGRSNREISDSLFISLQTVKDHVHRIYLKTGVKNRVQLINLIRSTGP